MIASMNAPVATNKWNLALTRKKTTSGPSSVASLNSGCGVVLSIVRSIKLISSYPSRRCFAPPQDGGYPPVDKDSQFAPKYTREGNSPEKQPCLTKSQIHLTRRSNSLLASSLSASLAVAEK